MVILICALLSCDKNVDHAPNVRKIAVSPKSLNAGTLFTLSVKAFDWDFERLSYHWEAEEGVFPEGDSASKVKWQSPPVISGKSIKITVTVSDERSCGSRMDTVLLLIDPQ